MNSITQMKRRRFDRPRADVPTYEIVRPLGTGGMATVYLAEMHSKSGSRSVAMKRLHDFIMQDPVNVAILEDEARLAGCIRHPNVVGIIDLLEGDGTTPPAIVMEWVEGVNLALVQGALKASGQRLPVDVAVAIVRDMLAGLHAAHEARRDDGVALEIVHRDVSPQNVLVGYDGVTRITDFGVAKAAWRSQRTEPFAIKGKLGYMAPEQLEGRADRRSDVYSAAIVLWELVTGRRFRSSEGACAQILVQILHGFVTAPSEIDANAVALDAVVRRALERDPEARYATAGEMIDALVAAVAPAPPARVSSVLRQIVPIAKDLEAPPSRRETTASLAATLWSVTKTSLAVDLGLDTLEETMDFEITVALDSRRPRFVEGRASP